VPRFNVCLAAVAAISIAASAADAQIIRRPTAPRTPNWAGVSVGIAQGYSIVDGSTSSDWDFGSGIEYAARFERPTSRGLSFGVQASFAKMPLAYSSTALSGDATARVTQFMGLLHYGRGYSFHPVYELAIGVVGFSDFPETKISNRTDYDPKFSIGYGFGFGLSSTASIEIIQEFGTILHQREGLGGGSSSYPRVYVTRIGGKMAF
jgi:hypothetical protein